MLLAGDVGLLACLIGWRKDCAIEFLDALLLIRCDPSILQRLCNVGFV